MTINFLFVIPVNFFMLKMINKLYDVYQWSLQCAPVYTSVHENYLTVRRKNFKIKNTFLNDINFVFF